MQPINNQQYYLQQQAQQQRQNEMYAVSVLGEMGAMAYPVAAGNTVLAFDWNEKLFWFKTTDINGVPQPMRKFKFEEIMPKQQIAATDTVSRAEFEEMQSSLAKILKMLENDKSKTELNAK